MTDRHPHHLRSSAAWDVVRFRCRCLGAGIAIMAPWPARACSCLRMTVSNSSGTSTKLRATWRLSTWRPVSTRLSFVWTASDSCRASLTSSELSLSHQVTSIRTD